MHYIKNPLAKERAIMNALAKGDKDTAEKICDELRREDKEATIRLIYAVIHASYNS